ncbi:aldehyde dehydrogenase family protein [Sphingomonas sp. BGYR3]|uniref:aldehyde dehydrogenase family protein n=1 Tax=Sphingomonas sp. BGYR3 TaxID=2975483 RepID=UPI0021A4AB2C|nr:aldehyde dehydrogenase family protein [Sphingomonas sp. BGYR3]MDG5487791.1 aldehyde dehydrogenase family protein [Sphingomonas sp. BGYR3]
MSEAAELDAPADRSAVRVDFNGPYALSIGGRLIETNTTFDVFNPATNEVLARAPDGSAEHLDAAVAGAKAAFPAWSAMSWDERGALIGEYADALEAHKDDLIRLLTLEQGKPRHSMAKSEVEAAIYWVREVAKRRLPPQVVEDTDEHVVEIRHTPLGVVGAITPWNFPVLLGLWKIAPCLVTGNTMVMKPSPYTPLCTLRFGEIAQQVFPAGVLNIVSGGNELGQQLTEHPDVAKISFTGSTATGKKVMASSAGTLKRVTLELGGKDPAIVLADADWQSIVPTLFWAAFGNSGQWCIASKRIYVHRSIHADFVAAFTDYARGIRVGDGMDPDTDLGPIQNRMQYDKLRSLFADVAEQGHKVTIGGTIDESLPGNFVPVTVVDNPPDDSRIVREEPFGPIVPILAFDEIDEVVARANDTPFGLAASVWGKDREAAIAVAERIEAGTVWVNEIHIHGIDIPFGGHKQSGLGVENGAEGLAEFTNTKTYMFRK